ncbi:MULTISPECIES: DUF3035 domain-containing protein [unclassified Yoonia]|uniref:DUF3035 domain-containing protein n=1 Tax=unclassified Yoonia TaxID=2629118 RepID=UPI002AFE4611|nr:MULTISPECIES: DUF3035 domain-containing protein [unclassified Yoonia]
MRAFIVSILALVALTACGRNDGGGPQFGVPVAVPAEQAVTPFNPLQMPATTALPPPTPGQGNRADPR